MKAGDWKYTMEEGFKGYGVGATYTLAKNMVYMLDYVMIWKARKLTLKTAKFSGAVCKDLLIKNLYEFFRGWDFLLFFM